MYTINIKTELLPLLLYYIGIHGKNMHDIYHYNGVFLVNIEHHGFLQIYRMGNLWLFTIYMENPSGLKLC